MEGVPVGLMRRSIWNQCLKPSSECCWSSAWRWKLKISHSRSSRSLCHCIEVIQHDNGVADEASSSTTTRNSKKTGCSWLLLCKQQSGLVTKSKEATLSFTKKNVNILAANQGDSRRPTPASSHRGQLQLFPGHCFRAWAVCWGKSEYIYLVSVNVPVLAASLPERWSFTYQ